ncbi:MAG: multidrug efflux SMR transporter [Mycobacteriaceae bacterium]|nr:multidrug efflux SMR transporter [Mycobacteriaceae bacterium]
MLLGAIVFEVTATLALRASDGFTKWGWDILVVAGYGASFAILALVLKRGMPVGIAYGIWAALGVVLTSTLARFLFGDPFTWLMKFGVVLIAAGVLLLEAGSSSHRAANQDMSINQHAPESQPGGGGGI